MNFKEYQEAAMKTAIYPNRGFNLVYPVLGLSGEAGEISEKVKKMIRDDKGVLSQERADAIKKELGDVLWYCAAVAYEIDTTLDEVAEINIAKLSARKEQNKLQGDGDDREVKS